MNSENINKTICPNCGFEINVNEILYHQLEDDIKKKYSHKFNEEKEKYDAQFKQLMAEKEEFEQKKKNENELFNAKLQSKLSEEKKQLELQIKKKLEVEQSEFVGSLQKELNEQTEQLKELGKSKAEIERLRREKETLKDNILAESEINLTKRIAEERERIQKTEAERNVMIVKELQKQLEDQKRLTEEMKRKQEQGSMQLQGEVQELAIEEWLSEKYPLDIIQEIKKGARGGDCVQIVNTRNRQNCGKIYFESKRTKEFQPSWIEKFKTDMREKDVHVGVLVTEVMPSDMPRMGLKDGIWICTFDEFKGLSNVLRESVIQINEVMIAQENRVDKVEMLYNYLTSNTFRMQVEAIVEGFTQMQVDLESEKRAMQRIWKSREKQIEKVKISTIDMYGSIKGIAGNAIQDINLLELPQGDLFLELE